MNCERVFDILTRGPFPTGEACDVHVERHLLACHDCRRLAEALRPAVELLHECVEGQEAESLPGYRGWLDEAPWGDDAPLPVGENHSAPVLPGTLPRRQPWVECAARGPGAEGRRVRRWWPWLSVAALVAAMGLLVASQDDGEPGPAGSLVQRFAAADSDDSEPSSGHREARLSDAGRQMLAQLALPAACRDPSAIGPDPDVEATFQADLSARELYFCCTHCHTARAARLGDAGTWKVTMSCDACHDGERVVAAPLNL